MTDDERRSDEERRRRVRINAWALAAVAILLYLGFIFVQMLRSAHG